MKDESKANQKETVNEPKYLLLDVLQHGLKETQSKLDEMLKDREAITSEDILGLYLNCRTAYMVADTISRKWGLNEENEIERTEL